METITQPDSWLGVELRHLAALEAVAREGTFGRAAAKLGYTQSAVSQQIASLERSVGERLLERPGGPRAVSLTEAGELLLRHAEAIVARLDAARADMASLRAGETGTLRVGTYQSVGARVLPAVMRRFTERSSGHHPRAARADDRSGALRPDRERRARSRVLQPAASGRPVRRRRADERPLRPRRLGRARARARVRLARRPRRPAADRLADVRERRPAGGDLRGTASTSTTRSARTTTAPSRAWRRPATALR